MPQIGPLEILVVGFVALIVFGPEKLPEIARSIGKGINQMKTLASNVKSEFDTSLADDDRAPAPVGATASPAGARSGDEGAPEAVARP